MSDFVPGEAYRIDIIGTDESVLVDSWNNQIRADIVTKSGLIQVDSNTGKVYGPFIGNIEDNNGEVVYDANRQEFIGSFKGDVLNQSGQILLDSTTNTINADIVGNIYSTDNEIILNINQKMFTGSVKGDIFDLNGKILIDATTSTINADIKGNIYNSSGELVFDQFKTIFFGNIKGDLLDSSNNVLFDSITKTFNGNVKGNVYNTANEIMVDVDTNTIHASGLYGDFYGNFSGSIVPNSVVYGNFAGEFSGNGYGEFSGNHIGDFAGSLVGDVTGNVTGNVLGDVCGNLLAQDFTRLTQFEEDLNCYIWLGGIGYPNPTNPSDIAHGPILIAGSTRAESSLAAHIHHYDSTPVLILDTTGTNPNKATFIGRVEGEVWHNDLPILTKSSFTTIHSSNNQLRLNAESGVIELFGSRIKKMINIINSDPVETVQAYRGTFNNKQPVQAGDRIGAFSVDVWDGQGFKQAGAFGFVADPNGNHNVENNFYPTVFGVVVSDGSSNPIENSVNRLEFNNKGILSAPMFKVGSKTFAEIDSLRPDEGTIVFNTSNKKFQGWTGTQWVDLH